MGRTKRESTAATLALSGRLGDLVDQWKYDNKKTQEELAKEIGVRASSLSDWINDSSTPTIDQLYKVAKFFDVPADYLIGLSNVQTLNTNLQATEKLTRLTGKAIERLGYNPKFKPMSPEEAERAIKEKKLKRRAWTDEEIALLSQMIEDDSILKIISHINNYRKWAKMDAFKRTRYRLTGEREEGMSIGTVDGENEFIVGTDFSVSMEVEQHRAEKEVTLYTEKMHESIEADYAKIGEQNGRANKKNKKGR